MREFAELISAAKIATRVGELGAQITADYRAAAETGDIVVIGVLKGSVIFLADLVRHVQLPVFVEFIGISSYGDATVSSGVVEICFIHVQHVFIIVIKGIYFFIVFIIGLDRFMSERNGR